MSYKYDKIRAHREMLKNQLFNLDYSNVPVNKIILVELDYKQITVQSEGPSGFTHHKSSYSELGSLIDNMNKYTVVNGNTAEVCEFDSHTTTKIQYKYDKSWIILM